MTTRWIFFILGFLTSFTSLSEFYLLRDLGFDIPTCFVAANLINLPWAFRPFWGYLSDRIAMRYRQLSVLFFAAFVVWSVLSEFRNPHFIVFMLTLAAISTAAGHTIADALVVRLGVNDSRAMSTHHRYRIVGKIIASCISGKLLTDGVDVSVIFNIEAILYLIAAASIFNARHESYVEPTTYETSYVDEMTTVIRDDAQIRQLLFIVTLTDALPNAVNSIQYFIVGPLCLSPSTLATVEVVKGAFDVAGTYVDPTTKVCDVLYAFGTSHNLMLIPTISLVCRTAIGVNDAWLIYPTTAVHAFTQSALITVFTWNAARVSPAGKEGAMFNGIVSLPMLGQSIGFLSTWGMTKWYGIDHDAFENLSNLVTMTSILSCAPAIVSASFR